MDSARTPSACRKLMTKIKLRMFVHAHSNGANYFLYNCNYSLAVWNFKYSFNFKIYDFIFDLVYKLNLVLFKLNYSKILLNFVQNEFNLKPWLNSIINFYSPFLVSLQNVKRLHGFCHNIMLQNCANVFGWRWHQNWICELKWWSKLSQLTI